MAGKLVTIATFGHLAEAQAAKNALEAAGIASALDNVQTSSLFGTVLPMIGIRLMVREEDEPQAVKILDDTFGSEPVSEDELTAAAEAAPAEDPVEAGQQQPPPVVPGADSLAREREARSALFAACLGLAIPFASLFALVLVLQASTGSGELSARGRRHLVAAALIGCSPLVLITLVLILFAMRQLWP
ncbi:DUF2007 domain-containing protein [Gemmata sp. JC717]|uniref:putative signal transducing protein n=1 Tax=Gemmata algarum TaxID=2975278 RepID=UPI0021BB8A97|nr:DUF2007 domain-containing protein [Gemmata algarum]MDY3552903.1 DUF2007 domain-containing protein [Gemmata algarum]